MLNHSAALRLFSLSLLLCGSITLAAQSTTQDAAPSATADQIPVTSAQSPEIPVFQKIEDNWSISVNRRDQYGLELVLSPLFVEISSKGEVLTRDQQVARLLNIEDKGLSQESHVITVRMLGDVAVVNGTYALKRKVNGNLEEERGVYTHVYQKVRAGWLCVNSQQTQLRDIGAAKTKKKSGGDEMPFHIPFFSK